MDSDILAQKYKKIVDNYERKRRIAKAVGVGVPLGYYLIRILPNTMMLRFKKAQIFYILKEVSFRCVLGYILGHVVSTWWLGKNEETHEAMRYYRLLQNEEGGLKKKEASMNNFLPGKIRD